MKRNPVAGYVKKTVRAYNRLLRVYADKAAEPLAELENLDPITAFPLRSYYLGLISELGNETRSFIVEAVDNVIDGTVELYNDLHRKAGQTPLTEWYATVLKTRLRREFLLEPFKGKTLDMRVDHAIYRLKVNIFPILENLSTAPPSIDTAISTIRQYFTGTHPLPGGTAARWNGRLIASELFRAYQHTARNVFFELGVDKVRWVNTEEHGEGNPARDYHNKVFSPEELPEYPYPCNDSFFIPIYDQ